MILLYGIPTETPLRLVADALTRRGTVFHLMNQRRSPDAVLRVHCGDRGLTGTFQCDGKTLALEEITGVYPRPMDDTRLPELRSEPPSSPRCLRTRKLHELFWEWIQVAPGVVVNRPRAMASNSCKPYQAHLIREAGMEVPDSLVTNDPDRVLEFRERHRRLIYKSISGARSIVREFTDEDRKRLPRIRGCPVHFQELIEGDDLRVHVVGERVFAARAKSTVTDYRYSSRFGGSMTMESVTLPAGEEKQCIRLSRSLGLLFSGIDFKWTSDGRLFCLEVNPCPAFSFYEAHTGQPIADAVAELLAEGRESLESC